MNANQIIASAAANQELEEALTGRTRAGRPGRFHQNSAAIYRPRVHGKSVADALARIGTNVPYNWGPFGGYQGSSVDPERVERARVEVGWLKAAADLADVWPTAKFLLGKFIGHGINGGNGVGSPYSCLVDIPVGRWAPGTLVRRMRAIRAKARVLMATSVTIRDPSWAAVAVAAAGKLPVGKAAVTAWAMTLSSPRLGRDSVIGKYPEARAWLVGHLASAPSRTTFRDWCRGVEAKQGCSVEVVEGVRAIHHPAEQVRAGITAERVVMLPTSRRGNPAGRQRAWVVRVGAFAYHAGDWYGNLDRKDAVKQGLDACRRARSVVGAGAELLPQPARRQFERGELEILVTRQDSYAAGNCSPGTEAFVSSQGWAGRWCAPASVLLASGNSRAQAAAMAALRRYADAERRAA